MTGRVLRRTCQICEACCGLLVTVNEQEQVQSVKGDPADPVSAGFVCPKSQALVGVAGDPDRLTRPLRKIDGRFIEIGWEEAFDYAAERLAAVKKAHGGQSVGFYIGNPTAGNPGLAVFSGALVGLMGTRQAYSASSVDAHPRLLTNALLYGDKAVAPIPDVDRCDFLLVVGANPVVSNGSLMTLPGIGRRMAALRERGGRIVVVDPRRSETAEIADEYVAIQPATDVLMLLAMAQVLFADGLVRLRESGPLVREVDAVRELVAPFSPESVEAETGVPAETIRRLARQLAAAEHAAIYGRIGACCQLFGTLTSWLTDVLTILTGNLDREGGLVFARPVPANVMARDPYVGDQAPYDRYRTRVRGFPEFARQYPAFVMAEEMETPGDGQLRALITLSGNPVLSFPNGQRLERAMGGLDFMMAVDIYLNETTRLADLILPSTTPLARPSFTQHFATYMVNSYARYGPPIMAKPEGTFDDWEIMLEIAARLSGTDRAALHRTYLEQVVGRMTQAQGVCHDMAPSDIADMLGGAPGPEQVFDLLLRIGEFGDQFGRVPDGLTLARLKAHPEGISFGPVNGGRLPHLLRTPDRTINLAPVEITKDFPRLHDFRAGGGFARQAPGSFILSSRRDSRSMNSWLHNVHAFAKGRDRCTLLMHPDDAVEQGIIDGQMVRVRNATGAITVKAALSADVQSGAVNLPHGFGHYLEGSQLPLARAQQAGDNVNLLLDEELIDVPSGNTAFNRVIVQVEPA